MMKLLAHILIFLASIQPLYAAKIQSLQEPLHIDVEVQVVELQISVVDRSNNFLTDLAPEDFVVHENGTPQTVLDVELHRQPFSIGIVIDTSSSMQSQFLRIGRAAKDFVRSLRSADEFFVLTFDDRIRLTHEMQTASTAVLPDFLSLDYGRQTKLYEGLISGLAHLKESHHPQRAIFLISDGMNSLGKYDCSDVIRTAQQNKTLIYSLILQKDDLDFNVMYRLAEETGGTHFVLDTDFPRLKAAYEKIASDLAHRITLYYQSKSDYTKEKKPLIQIKTKNPAYKVRFQKAFYFPEE
jgi:VWFA-related protein